MKVDSFAYQAPSSIFQICWHDAVRVEATWYFHQRQLHSKRLACSARGSREDLVLTETAWFRQMCFPVSRQDLTWSQVCFGNSNCVPKANMISSMSWPRASTSSIILCTIVWESSMGTLTYRCPVFRSTCHSVHPIQWHFTAMNLNLPGQFSIIL